MGIESIYKRKPMRKLITIKISDDDFKYLKNNNISPTLLFRNSMNGVKKSKGVKW